MPNVAKQRFVEQQGFGRVEGVASDRLFSALMLQPRMAGIFVGIGLVLQNGWYFLALSGILWWSALVPALNPFDAIYNALIARPRGYSELGSAPAPRRFAQGMSATFMLAIGVSLLAGATMAAWVLEGFLVAALLSLIAGRLCLGSYIYHVVSGRPGFANRTLPWGRA